MPHTCTTATAAQRDSLIPHEQSVVHILSGVSQKTWLMLVERMSPTPVKVVPVMTLKMVLLELFTGQPHGAVQRVTPWLGRGTPPAPVLAPAIQESYRSWVRIAIIPISIFHVILVPRKEHRLSC